MRSASVKTPPILPPVTPPLAQRSVVRFEIAPSTVFQIILMATAVWLMIELWSVFLVLVIALLLAGTMSPVVTWMEGRGTSRGLAVGVAFTLLFLVGIGLAILTLPSFMTQAAALIEREPEFRKDIANYLALSKLTAPISGWLRNLKYSTPAMITSDTAFAVSVRIIEIVAYAVSSIVLAVYIMLDRDRLRGALFAIVPRSHHIRLARVILNLETIVGAYIRGQMVTCTVIAVFSFVLLMLCGVPNPLALAVFAGVADVLPYIGALLSIAPMVLAALAQGPGVAAVVLLVMLAYEEFESRILVPRIYGRALRLPSAVVLLALLAGGTLMGILGALLALPLAATVVMLIDELRVELPGQTEQFADTEQRVEEEYERRTEGVPAQQAAAIAVAISDDRRKEESRIPEADPSSDQTNEANAVEKAKDLAGS